ncbi:hypothetical protein [Ruminiclostridium cellulolyticum]|uniref:Uncharacterized protein n=1 Tax=Ruminiclostridium cellulolyticum (strain ATCC 35319 / DSM 5812 / JCM 6584 / H10) TaxID=394503 RepID=B8I4F4_RUMCH|nr:hypothetical protein [Ruminiclostridium cellulolyticum]ACL74508.1 hypothetical protein Ccel_0120 [Ruminiclostridium cellulolyticum H10]
MNKIYAFFIIIPLIAVLFLKTLSFYEFDTKQRYVKNEVDSIAHKVMITGAMTVSDKEELLEKLGKLGTFRASNISIKCGSIQPDGTVAELGDYVLGSVLDRGSIFTIYVDSESVSIFSETEGNSADEDNELHYRAKATCRVEKSSRED